MNYYHAAEMLNPDGTPSGKYRFVCQSTRHGIYAVGYCGAGCEGHDTPEAACEHYRAWELDNARFDGLLADPQERCEICGAWTLRFAQLPDGYQAYTLCDEHCNRDGLATVHGRASAFWEGAE